METDFSKLWGIHGALSELLTKTSFIVNGADALTSMADYFDVLKTESSRQAIDGELRMISERVDALAPDGRLGTDVVAGKLNPARWVSIAETQWNALLDLQKRVGHSSALRFADAWGEVLVPTAVAVQEKVEAAAESVSDNFIPLLVLVVVGLIALAVVKVA